jgi:hypothetical protein
MLLPVILGLRQKVICAGSISWCMRNARDGRLFLTLACTAPWAEHPNRFYFRLFKSTRNHGTTQALPVSYVPDVLSLLQLSSIVCFLTSPNLRASTHSSPSRHGTSSYRVTAYHVMPLLRCCELRVRHPLATQLFDLCDRPAADSQEPYATRLLASGRLARTIRNKTWPF